MFWLPEAASSYAADLDWLFFFITAIVGVWFVAVQVLLLYLVVRYRRRPGRRAEYIPARGLRAMSIVLIPCAVILVLDLVIDAVAAPVWHHVKETIPEHDQLVRIQGEQWAWRFTLPGPDGALDTDDDLELVNELHIPVNAVVKFELTAKDVLHSFSVSEFRLKQDAVPGRTIRGWFQPISEGRFEIPCVEICGFAHTMMKGTLVVESQEAFEGWLQSKSASARNLPATRDSEAG